MEFIGLDPSVSIPIPNPILTPEMICKNYPLDFLLQPIIPLLPPFAAAKTPSFFITFPSWLKETCLEMSRSLRWYRPSLQCVSLGIAATGLSYFVWKMSLKWNYDLCGGSMNVEPEVSTEKLDQEVERILSTIPEEHSVSTCFSFTDHRDFDPNRINSFTSSATGVFSKEQMCSCEQVFQPIVTLQSRIDQVMSRVEDVMSGIKALESSKSLASKMEDKEKGVEVEKVKRVEEVKVMEKETKEPLAVATSDKEMKEKSEKHRAEKIQRVTSVEECIETNERRLTELSQGIKDLEFQLQNIKNTPEKDEKTICDPYVSPFGVESSLEKSPSVITLSNENDKESADNFSVRKLSTNQPSPPCFRMENSPFRSVLSGTISSPHLERLSTSSPNRRRSSPLRKTKRAARFRNYNLRPFPLLSENSPRCTDDLGVVTNDAVANRKSVVRSPVKLEPTLEINTYSSNNYQHFHKDETRQQTRPNFDYKRQDTWPTVDGQWKLPCKNSELNDNDTDIRNRLVSKLPETSFQFTEPSTVTATTEVFRFKEVMNEDSSMASRNHNDINVVNPMSSFLRGVSEKDNDNLLSKSNGDKSCGTHPSVNAREPLVIAREPLTPVSKSTNHEALGKMSGISDRDQLSKHSDLGQIREPTNPTGPQNKDELLVHTRMCQKHKLMSSESESPPRKLSQRERLDGSTTFYNRIFSTDKSGQNPSNTTQDLPTATVPQNPSGVISKALSPIKRSFRKKNDFQVKYIPKGKDSDENHAVPSLQSTQSDKEEEWIVIVPSAH